MYLRKCCFIYWLRIHDCVCTANQMNTKRDYFCSFSPFFSYASLSLSSCGYLWIITKEAELSLYKYGKKITLTISNILIKTLLRYAGIYYGLMRQQKFITLNLFKLSDIYLYTVKGSHTVYFRIEWVINLISTYLIQSAKF